MWLDLSVSSKIVGSSAVNFVNFEAWRTTRAPFYQLTWMDYPPLIISTIWFSFVTRGALKTGVHVSLIKNAFVGVVFYASWFCAVLMTWIPQQWHLSLGESGCPFSSEWTHLTKPKKHMLYLNECSYCICNSPHTTIYHCISPYITVYHRIWSYITVCHHQYLPWFCSKIVPNANATFPSGLWLLYLFCVIYIYNMYTYTYYI